MVQIANATTIFVSNLENRPQTILRRINLYIEDISIKHFLRDLLVEMTSSFAAKTDMTTSTGTSKNRSNLFCSMKQLEEEQFSSDAFMYPM